MVFSNNYLYLIRQEIFASVTLISLMLFYFQMKIMVNTDHLICSVQTTALDVPTSESGSSESYPPQSRQIVPLTKLIGSKRRISCPEGLVEVLDTVLDPKLAWAGGRKIPRIIHTTSKSRCMVKEFSDNLDKWRFKDHSFFFHDEKAMDRLLTRYWHEFPFLQQIQKCLLYDGAAKADIWRALVLYEYGGIYTDMDHAPVKFNGSTLGPEDEALFAVDGRKTPSQWFMVSAPRHPIMYMLIMTIMNNMYKLKDTADFPIVFATGPGALKDAFQRFSQKKGDLVAGTYVGLRGRTVRIIGDKSNMNEYVNRNTFSFEKKRALYPKMNMTHIKKMPGLGVNRIKNNMSCFDHLYRLEEEEKGPMEQLLMW